MDVNEHSLNSEETEAAEGGPRLPEFVEWIGAAIIGLAGVALTVGGSTLTVVADRDLVEDGVTSGEITVVIFERELTEPETIELTLAVVTWTGWGLLVTGLALVLFAIGYVVVRHRAYQETPDTESAGSSLSYAVLGAVATGILSFIPFSPVIGGGMVGYLEHYGSGRAVQFGALSGFLATVPGLVILVFVTAGLYRGLGTIQYANLGLVTAAVMGFVLLFTAAYGAVLGALGGFAGEQIAE